MRRDTSTVEQPGAPTTIKLKLSRKTIVGVRKMGRFPPSRRRTVDMRISATSPKPGGRETGTKDIARIVLSHLWNQWVTDAKYQLHELSFYASKGVHILLVNLGTAILGTTLTGANTGCPHEPRGVGANTCFKLCASTPCPAAGLFHRSEY